MLTDYDQEKFLSRTARKSVGGNIKTLPQSAVQWLAHRRTSIRSAGTGSLPKAASLLTGLVYPSQCVTCHVGFLELADRIPICGACRRDLEPPVATWCKNCGAPVSVEIASNNECIHCQGEKFPWAGVIALGKYDGALSRAVVRTKMPSGDSISLALGRLLCDRRRESLTALQIDSVVPMPMHWLRRLKRGTNGPDLIAEILARQLGLSLRRRWLKRCRLTPLQTDISPTQRQRGQRKSFRLRRGVRVTGQRILLVDDVLTTGSTAAEAAKIFLSAGAASISIAVIARGVGADVH